MDSKRNIAIIIVLYNPSEDDKQNIFNIATFCEGIIVDNSDKPTYDLTQIGNIKYYWLNGNKGIAFAQNYAIKIILNDGHYSYIMFLDQDSRINVDYIKGMKEEYYNLSLKKSNLALLGPIVINQESNTQYHSLAKGNSADDSGFVMQKNIISSGSCISCDKIRQIGLLNSNLFIDYVDSEWCWRANKMGYICGQTTKFNLLHHIGIKTINLGIMQDIISAPFRYYYQYRNYLWLARIGYVPTKWKIKNAIRLFFRPLYIPIFSKSPAKCYKNIFAGVYDGLTKFNNFRNEKNSNI